MNSSRAVYFDINWNACIQCGACVAVCPQPAGFITSFDTIAVDKACTIACMACEYICPVETISHYKKPVISLEKEQIISKID